MRRKRRSWIVVYTGMYTTIHDLHVTVAFTR